MITAPADRKTCRPAPIAVLLRADLLDPNEHHGLLVSRVERLCARDPSMPYQVAYDALLIKWFAAIRGYDASLGYAPSTYICTALDNAITDAIRLKNRGYDRRNARGRFFLNMATLTDELAEELPGQDPCPLELAAEREEHANRIDVAKSVADRLWDYTHYSAWMTGVKAHVRTHYRYGQDSTNRLAARITERIRQEITMPNPDKGLTGHDIITRESEAMQQNLSRTRNTVRRLEAHINTMLDFITDIADSPDPKATEAAKLITKIGRPITNEDSK